MSERILDPESLDQVEAHVDNILIIKLYEFIIQANIDLSADGVVSSSVVAEMLNDDKSSVTENAIRFVWETIRNKMVLKTRKPEAFPVGKLLAAVPTLYFQTHPEAIDTLLQLKDETGNFVFLGLGDFLGQAATVVRPKNIECQDLCDIDAWLTFNQTITIENVNAARAVRTSIATADDVLALSNIVAGVDLRKNAVLLAPNNTAILGTNINDDAVVAPQVDNLVGQRAAYYANALGAGSNVGLLRITANPAITAGANQEGLVFLVSGTAAAQHVGGLPAIYSYSLGTNATTFGTTLTMLSAGTGWRATASITAEGGLIFNLASKVNLLAAGYAEADIKDSYLNTATGTVTLTDIDGATARTLSLTVLSTAIIDLATGVTGPAGLGLVSINATEVTGVTGLHATTSNTFLVSSTTLQANGAKPAIVQFAVSGTAETVYGAATVLEPGENWIATTAISRTNTTFVLATEANLRAAGYAPDTKYISGSVTNVGTGGNTTGLVGIVDPNKEGAGLAALSANALTGVGLNGTAANSTDTAFFVLAQGIDTTAQLANGQPAIVQFTLISGTNTTAATAGVVLAPGTGFLAGARVAGKLKFTIATESNLRAAGYIPVPQTNFSTFNAATSITQSTTIAGTLSFFTSSTSVLVKREFARVANTANMPKFTFAPANDSLYTTALLYNTARTTSFEGSPITSAKLATKLVKYLKGRATASQLEVVELLLANADVNKPSALTLIFINRINSVLLKKHFATTKPADIVTFLGTVDPADITPNFNMKYYHTLSPVQLLNSDISHLYGLFAVFSTLDYSAEEVLKAARAKIVGAVIQNEGVDTANTTLTAPAQIILRASDLERFYPNFIKSQSISRRVSLFSDLVTPPAPVAPSGALLLASEDLDVLHKEIYDNSRTPKSRYTQLIATNGLPYEQQVAERVVGLSSTNGTRSITGIKSIISAAGGASLQKGSLLTVTSGTTGKAVFLVNNAIAIVADTRKFIASGDLTLLSTTVGGFAANFITHPINSDNVPAIAPAFALLTLTASGGLQTIYEFSEPIARSSGFKLGGVVFDEDNLFVESKLFAAHLPEFYTLDNPTSDGARAPGAGPATLASVATTGKYNVTPTLANGPLTVQANLNRLYQLVGTRYGVPVWMVMVAAAAGNTSLRGAQLLTIDLVNTVLAKKELGSVLDILNIPIGKWSNDLEPIEVVISIVDAERALFIDVKPYVEAVLNFAKSHLFDTVRAVNTKGNALIVKLMEAARDDDDRSNILLMMGTTPEIQLVNLTNILSLVKMPKIKLFNYYFAQFSMATLIDGLPEIVTSPGIPTSSSVCTSFWHTLFNSLDGIKQLRPYVPADVLLTYNRSVTPIDVSAGVAKSSTTSLTFKPTFIIQAYYPDDTIISGTAKLNALVADMGISFS
jgi:hypothetical protein